MGITHNSDTSLQFWFFFTYPISNGLGASMTNGQLSGSCLGVLLGAPCTTEAIFVDSIIVNGMTYKEVIKCWGGETVNANPIDTAYYAKGIGIIRKEYRKGEIYDLVDFEIKK